MAEDVNVADEPTAKLPPEELIYLTPDVWTTPFWEAAAEHRLVIPRCTSCGTYRRSCKATEWSKASWEEPACGTLCCQHPSR